MDQGHKTGGQPPAAGELADESLEAVQGGVLGIPSGFLSLLYFDAPLVPPHLMPPETSPTPNGGASGA